MRFTREVLAGAKLTQICSVSRKRLVQQAAPIRPRRGLAACIAAQVRAAGAGPEGGPAPLLRHLAQQPLEDLTNWPRRCAGSAAAASTITWKGSLARIAFALSVRSMRALRPSLSEVVRIRILAGRDPSPSAMRSRAWWMELGEGRDRARKPIGAREIAQRHPLRRRQRLDETLAERGSAQSKYQLRSRVTTDVTILDHVMISSDYRVNKGRHQLV